MSAPFNEFGPFAVGEVCRIVLAHNYPELMGVEVTITSGLLETNALDGAVHMAHKTDLRHKGHAVCVPEANLRRRKPPASDTGEQRVATLIRETLDRAPQRVGEPA